MSLLYTALQVERIRFKCQILRQSLAKERLRMCQNDKLGLLKKEFTHRTFQHLLLVDFIPLI